MSVHVLGSGGFISSGFKAHTSSNFIFWGSSLKGMYHFDLYNQATWASFFDCKPEVVVINSWPGLPNYHQVFHLSKTMPAMINLIDKLIDINCKKIIFSGTCYEYGDCSGMVSETQATNPLLPYSIAKDTLRRYIEFRHRERSFQYVWARIFYPFGINQNKDSLYPSLINAIQNNYLSFRIGPSSQQRDFISINNVISDLIKLVYHQDACGVYNICSGVPQSIFEFCSSIINYHNSPIQLIEDESLRRSSEPTSFWGNRDKIVKLFHQ